MIAAITFLTVVGHGRAPTRGALRWFPVVGAALGAVLGAVWWAAAEVWTPGVAAALVVVVDLALTGMLHVDGVADAADGLLPHATRQRRLAIMATPDVGAFGVAALVATLLLRWSALAALGPDVWLLVALWTASRSLMAFGATAMPYARPGGIATAFAGGSIVPAVGGVVAAGAVGGLAGGWPLAAAVGGAGVVGGSVLALSRRRLGGFTGDVLGAAGVLAETAGLLVAAA